LEREIMKKLLLFAVFIFALSNTASAEMIMPASSIEEEVIRIEKPNQAYTMLNGIRKDRNTIYNVLNLTPSQICKTREIEKSRFEEISPLIDELMLCKKKLKELCTQKASKKEICAVERKINKLSKQIKRISEKHDKCFEKLLNNEQKNKYEMIQKLRREDYKKLDKIEKQGRKQSDLRPFGCNVSQAQFSQELKEQRSFKNRCKKLFKRK